MKGRHSPNRGNPRNFAFTLIELIVVIAIIALITAATAPTLFSTMKSNRLTSSGEDLANRISLAQQFAVARNQMVELRFYRYTDRENTTTGDQYRATLIVAPSPDPEAAGAVRYQALSEMSRMKSGIVVANDADLSPPLHEAGRDDQEDTERYIPEATARYKAFRFFPDGSCDFPITTNQAYLTVVDAMDLDTENGLPPNFLAVQVDHYTSRITTHRP